MADSEKTVLIALCMVCDGDSILLQNRKKHSLSGLGFPGGHVERAEPFVKAIIREIKEETGLTIENPRMCGIKHFYTDEGERQVVLLFKTDKFSGELRSSAEGEVVWVKREDLAEHRVVKGFADLLRIFDDSRLTEVFYGHDEEGKRLEAELY